MTITGVEITPEERERRRQLWYLTFAEGNKDLKALHADYGSKPAPPRCRLCRAPFAGVGGEEMRAKGIEPSSRNPRFCNLCDKWIRDHAGGAAVTMSFLFVDVRGSVALSAKLDVMDFAEAMQRFYTAVAPVLYKTDGFIVDLVGDEMVALYPPGFSGHDHARKAVEAAREILRLDVRAPDGTRLGLKIGVHMGRAYIGTVTAAAVGLEDVRALGAPPSITARLAAEAGPGEAYVSEECLDAAGGDPYATERQLVHLKGYRQPLAVRVLRATEKPAPARPPRRARRGSQA